MGAYQLQDGVVHEDLAGVQEIPHRLESMCYRSFTTLNFELSEAILWSLLIADS